MKKTVTRMADGRELIYYDESDDARRCGRPARSPAATSASRLRYDPLMDEWIAIAAHRQTRTFLPPTDECPLCPSTADRLTEIPRRLRRRRLREPLPVVQRPRPRPGRSGPAVDQPAAPRARTVRGGVLHRPTTTRRSPHSALARVRTVLAALGRSDHGALRARPVWSRSSASRIAAKRSASRCTTRTGRSTLTRTSRPGPGDARVGPPARDRDRRRNLFADVLAAERSRGRARGRRERALDRVRPGRGPLALRGARGAAPRGCRTCRRSTEEERDAFGAALSRCLAPLRRASSARPMPYIAAWHQAPVRVDRDLAYLHLQLFSIRRAQRQAQVPRRIGGGDGRVRQRRAPGGRGRACCVR